MDRRGFLKKLGATGAGSILAPALLRKPAEATELGLLRYPYIQDLRADRATILWSTLESGLGTVEYSSDHTLSSSVRAEIQEFTRAETGLARHYQYKAELTGLSAGTEYFYRVRIDGQNVTQQDKIRFRTAGPGPFSFLVFGDCGMGSPQQFRLAQLKMSDRPALALLTGDLVYPNGTFAEYHHRYFPYYRHLMKRVPFFPSLGNHDYETDNAAPYLALHTVPTEDVPVEERGRYYSFDWSNVHFISLDSVASLAHAVNGHGRMLEWLENDLEKTGKFWRVVYFHHPPYASGPNENDPISAMVRDHIVPILERYDVNLVFNGHEHSYQRTEPIRNRAFVEEGTGTVYITTGGGGAQLYPVSRRPGIVVGISAHHYIRGEVRGHQMTLRSIRANGREMDSVTLAPPPLIYRNGKIKPSSLASPLAPKSLLIISGRHLAVEDSPASALPLPTELSGTAVMLNGRPLQLLYVSSSEIIAPITQELPDRTIVRVTTPNGSAETSVAIS